MRAKTEGTQRRLRLLNLTMLLPLLTAAGALVVAKDSRSWWHVLVLGLGMAAGLVAFERWTADDLFRVALPSLAVGAVVWPVGALQIGSSNAFWGLSVAGSLVVPRLSRHRAAAAFGLVAYIAAVGAARLLVTPDDVRGAYGFTGRPRPTLA